MEHWTKILGCHAYTHSQQGQIITSTPTPMFLGDVRKRGSGLTRRAWSYEAATLPAAPPCHPWCKYASHIFGIWKHIATPPVISPVFISVPSMQAESFTWCPCGMYHLAYSHSSQCTLKMPRRPPSADTSMLFTDGALVPLSHTWHMDEEIHIQMLRNLNKSYIKRCSSSKMWNGLEYCGSRWDTDIRYIAI